MHWNGDWHMGWMWLWWILPIVAIAVVIWFMANASRRSGNGAGSHESPEQILKRRYAKGEIDRDTYERTLEDLHN